MRKTVLGLVASAVVLGGAPFVAGSIDPAYAQRYDRRIEIVNNTGLTIRTVNSTNIARGDWGVDLLGRAVIPPGRSMVINVEDYTGYCRYDFRAVFADGRQVTRRGVNVCEAVQWIIS
jgi:hypothetical protein